MYFVFVRSRSRKAERCGRTILRKLMISCLTLEMSRTISDVCSPSKISSSMRSSLLPILRSIGNDASTQLPTTTIASVT